MRPYEETTEPRPLVAIIGGAVSGSEAAARLAAHGALAVVFEQNARPYGKIEDGLPRWHEKLRDQEYEKIDANLATEGVAFVPGTSLGHDVTIGELVELGFSAIVLANGAWRDRPLALDGVAEYLGRGLLYQNALVRWFNHAHEPGFVGEAIAIPDDVLVVGGGLASIDVAKIVNLELYRAALAARGIVIDVVELETAGIAETLAKHAIDPASLGIRGATLYYRRRKQDMPLAQAASDDPKAVAKAENARVKVMERVERKYLVRFEGLHSPVAPIAEDGRLVGLRFVRNEPTERGVSAVPGSEYDVRGALVVSSIGSIPVALPGVPMRGELYDFEDPATGRLRGTDRVFGLGNVLTGKGNIRDSRENAIDIAEHVVASYLGVAEGDARAPGVRSRISDETIEAALEPSRWASPAAIRAAAALVEKHWARTGYGGDYPAWIRGHR